MRVLLLALLLALPLGVSGAEAQRLAGRAVVVDGDTLQIRGVRVRLFGVDAPESAQPCVAPSGRRWRCGTEAAQALADRIGQATVMCVGRGRDRYRRVVAVCTQDGEDLGRWLVLRGWAVASLRYSHDYAAAEDVAERARRGVWSGQFDFPWDWRRAHRRG